MINYKVQKNNKPTVNRLIEELPEGLKEGIIDFITFLSENKMNPSWYARNSYNVNYKGDRVCRLRINYGENEPMPNVQIHLYHPEISELEKLLAEQTEELKNSFIVNAPLCNGCGRCKSNPHKYVHIDNEELHICSSMIICVSFFNPTELEYQFSKELINLRRIYINNLKIK